MQRAPPAAADRRDATARTAATGPPAGVLAEDVLGEDVLAVVDEKVADAEQLLEQLSAGGDALQVDQLATEVLDAAPRIMQLMDKAAASWSRTAKSSKPVAVQDLELRPLTTAERALVKYSALGQVLLDGAAAAVATLPFGQPVAALLGAVYGKAVQCVKNRGNCNLLVQQIKRCDTQLARVVVVTSSKHPGQSSSSSGSSSSGLPEGVLEGLKSLTEVIQKSAAAIAKYSERGCIKRFIRSSSDQQLFQQLVRELQEAMQWTSFVVSMETLALTCAFKDESAELRAAVCRAVGLPESQAEQALEQLSQQDPAKLRALLQQHGSFSDQVVLSELQALAGRIFTLEREVVELRKTIQQLVEGSNRLIAKGPEGMADFITQWWNDAVSKFQPSVAWPRFKTKLLDSLAAAVEKCARMLAEEAEDNGWALPADCSPKEVFLDKVLLQLLDADGDQLITKSELKALQEMGLAYAAKEQLEAPADMGELLEFVHACHTRNRLQLELAADSTQARVAAMLQAGDIIKSYNTARLLDDYLPGTRTWLCDKIIAWQQAAAQQQDSSSRMFLLLAEAGMGKSVCSAVLLKHLAAANAQVAAAQAKQRQLIVAHHFFKVGQQRGEGKAMIRCLAQQLCDQLPGLADQVEQQIQEVPDLASLSMVKLFDRLLLTPLQQLDQQLKQKPECLLLLDALDESTDNNQGWQPVCNLVAAQFQRLPSWVCVLVTGRPQVESRFANWKPASWIAATDQHNQQDLRRVLVTKLRLSKLVDDSLMDEAANLLLKKSQGQFIYAKYVFNTLEEQPHWSLEELQRLPDGLTQVYCYQLDTILAALQAERPELVALFKDRLLPMLAVMKEALPTHLLAWLVQGNQEEQAQQEDVALLLRLLYSLFPSRPGADGTLEVAPYHKSVQDFLLCEPGQGAASAAQLKWQMPAAEAHKLFVARLLPELQKPQLQHWRDACGPQVLPDLPAAQQYCLQYAVDHIALAQDWAALHQLLRHLPGLKAVLEVPGQVYKLMRVLTEAADNSQAEERQVFVGVQRFLRTASSLIAQDPHSVLQEMAYSPRDCVLGDLCEQDYQVQQAIADTLLHQASSAFWTGALLSPLRSASSPAEVALLQGHTKGVTCCAISPDGETVVSGSADQSLKVWEMSTGRLRSTLEGHEGMVTCCAITPDGRLLVSGSEDATLSVWDLDKHQLQSTLRGHTESVGCCAISPDGKTLVSGSEDKTLKVWDLPGGKLRATVQQGECVSCCAISPDGQMLVTGHDNGKVKVWDVHTGKVRTTLEGHDDRVDFCAISPDSQWLVTGRYKDAKEEDEDNDEDGSDNNDNDDDDDDNDDADGDNDNDVGDNDDDDDDDGNNDDGDNLKVWNLSTGALRTCLKPAVTITSCNISPDMMVIAACGQSECLYVWDLLSGQQRTKVEGAGLVTCCAISPDGQTLVSGSATNATLTVWDLPAALEGLKAEEPVGAQDRNHLCCAVSSHTLVLAWNDAPPQVWDLRSGQLHTFQKEPVYCCTISPDGQVLVWGSLGRPLQVWDLASGQLRATLEWKCDEDDCCVISSDGKTLVACYTREEENGEEEEEAADGVNDSGDDGSRSQESERSLQKGDLHVWDLPTGQLRTTLTHEGGNVSCCATSADARLLVSGSLHSIKVWDLATRKEIATLPVEDKATTECCAISSDGQLLACAFYSGSESNNIKVWDVPTGKLRMALRAHHDYIPWCAISPDGKTLTCCSYDVDDEDDDDKTVQVWNLVTGEEQHKVVQAADYCAMSPDGQVLAFVSSWGKLKAWVLIGDWQKGPAPPPYDEAMSLHRWCPGAPGFYLL